MNKKLSIILTTGACAGLIAAAGLSQSRAQSNMDQPKSGQKQMQRQMEDTETTVMERSSNTPAADMRTVTVTVKDVDRDAHMVTFQAKVSPEANIKKDGASIEIDDLQPGDSLKVAFDPRTGEVTRAEVVQKKAMQ